MEHLTNRMAKTIHIMTGVWYGFSLAVRAIIAQIVSLAIFLLIYSLAHTPITLALRLLTGLFALLLLPGAFTSTMILPPRFRNIATTLLVGIVVALLGVQFAFTIALVSSIRLPLAMWLSAESFIITALFFVRGSTMDTDQSLSMSFKFQADRSVHAILVIAVVLRIALSLVSMDNIAPDAALYADYARSVVDGMFQTNVATDVRVYALWNEVQYCFHQAFTYLFAISWVLLPPGISGPTFILNIAGVLLIMIGYVLVKEYYGATAAKYAAAILAFHPLFLFHSSVGYGPEITSLVFMIGGFVFFIQGDSKNKATFFFAGLLFGLTDLTWYANFLLICVVFPIIMILLRFFELRKNAVLAVVMALILVARLFYTNAIIFIICWAAVFAVLGLLQSLRPQMKLKELGVFSLGIFLTVVLWRWPIQVSNLESQLSSALDVGSLAFESDLGALISVAPNPNLRVFFAPITLEITMRFFFFVFFHITPVLLCVIIYGLATGKHRLKTIAFLVGGCAAAFGTLKLFSAFAIYKDPLRLVYIFSDSRFFLFISLMAVIASGSYFSDMHFNKERQSLDFSLSLSEKEKKRVMAVFIVVIIGFIPGYVAIPSGLALIDFEERYGWTGLVSEVQGLGDENSVFLADRAPEFSWLTNRKSAELSLSGYDFPTRFAYANLASQSSAFGTEFLLLDTFTLAHWRTFQSLLYVPLAVGDSVMIDASLFSGLESENETGLVSSLAVVAETEHLDIDNYLRLFRFESARFVRTWKTDNLGDEWLAGNDGLLVNSTNNNMLVIGPAANHTFLSRSDGFNLGVHLDAGFFICKIADVDGIAESIVLLDDSGVQIGLAEHVFNGIYYALLGNVQVDNIRVNCHGAEGQSISIKYLSLWEMMPE